MTRKVVYRCIHVMFSIHDQTSCLFHNRFATGSRCMTRNVFSCAMRDVVVATQKGCFRNEIIVFVVISQVGKLNLFFIMFTYPSD